MFCAPFCVMFSVPPFFDPFYMCHGLIRDRVCYACSNGLWALALVVATPTGAQLLEVALICSLAMVSIPPEGGTVTWQRVPRGGGWTWGGKVV